jgi:hypothetical protein
MMGRSSDGLTVYVTSHGFGHLNRTVAALNLVPSDVPITICCHHDLFDHWGERLRRPAEFREHVSDAGAVNPPGDSAATDGPATLALAARVHAQAVSRLDDEADWLRATNPAAVLCDSSPLPLVAARRAGVPGFLLANFTWADIYQPHARMLGPEALALVRDLRASYRQATALFHAQPGLAMSWLKDRVDVGMVVTHGRDRRVELRRSLGLGVRDRLVYFYVGRYGQDGMGWERIAGLGKRGIHFVGFHEAPIGPLPNLHVVPAERWTGAELAASSDAIVAKAGYGSTCEAMVAGTPLIYPPRTGFAEFRALDRALRTWGGALPASRRQFDELRLGPLLERAFALRPGPVPFPTDGASRVAERLTRLCQGLAVA